MFQIHISEIREDYDYGTIRGGYYVLSILLDDCWLGTLEFKVDKSKIYQLKFDSKLTWCGYLWAIKNESVWTKDVSYLPISLGTLEKLANALTKVKCPKENRYVRRLARSNSYASNRYPSLLRVLLSLPSVDMYTISVSIGTIWLSRIDLANEGEAVIMTRFSSRLSWYALLEVLLDSKTIWEHDKHRNVPNFLLIKNKLVSELITKKSPRNNLFSLEFVRNIKR